MAIPDNDRSRLAGQGPAPPPTGALGTPWYKQKTALVVLASIATTLLALTDAVPPKAKLYVMALGIFLSALSSNFARAGGVSAAEKVAAAAAPAEPCAPTVAAVISDQKENPPDVR